jgi:hypothetical protein
MSLRLLAVVAEFVLAGAVIGWGVATTLRPQWWTARGAQWWVGWTREPVARTHGIAVALVGIGLLAGAGAVAAASAPPDVAIPALVRDLQLAGLAVVVLGGALLAATHPGPDAVPTVPAGAVAPLPDVAVVAEVPPLTAAT